VDNNKGGGTKTIQKPNPQYERLKTWCDNKDKNYVMVDGKIPLYNDFITNQQYQCNSCYIGYWKPRFSKLFKIFGQLQYIVNEYIKTPEAKQDGDVTKYSIRIDQGILFEFYTNKYEKYSIWINCENNTYKLFCGVTILGNLFYDTKRFAEKFPNLVTTFTQYSDDFYKNFKEFVQENTFWDQDTQEEKGDKIGWVRQTPCEDRQYMKPPFNLPPTIVCDPKCSDCTPPPPSRFPPITLTYIVDGDLSWKNRFKVTGYEYPDAMARRILEWPGYLGQYSKKVDMDWENVWWRDPKYQQADIQWPDLKCSYKDTSGFTPTTYPSDKPENKPSFEECGAKGFPCDWNDMAIPKFCSSTPLKYNPETNFTKMYPPEPDKTNVRCKKDGDCNNIVNMEMKCRNEQCEPAIVCRYGGCDENK